MHATIGHALARDKTTKPLLRFDCYLDTTSWHFPVNKLGKGDWSHLCKLYGDEPHRKEYPRDPALVLSFQCPQPDLIVMLEDVARKCSGNLSRCDIANDVRPGSTDLDCIEQTKLLWRSIILRGRPKTRGRFEVYPNADGTIGTLWNPFLERPRQKAPAIDIGAYPDLCSKLHGVPTGHFDLRLRSYARRNAMRDQDIGPEGRSLTELDPSLVIRHFVKFVQCDSERERREYFQWLAKGQTHGDAHRLIEHAKRYGQLEYVQRLNDQYPNLHVQEDRNMVSFPHTLTWGAVRRELSKDVSVRHMIKSNDDNGLRV